MRVSLPSLRAFSECPRYYYMLQEVCDSPISKRVSIVISTIKKCYLLAMETGFRASWKSIIGWVDRDVFKDVDISNEESFNAAKMLSEQILNAIHAWYHTLYMKENSHTYIDIDLQAQLEDCMIFDRIDVIQLTSPIQVTLFSETSFNVGKMYNDIVVRGRAWLVAKHLDCEDVVVRMVGIGQRGGFSFETLRLGTRDHASLSNSFLQIYTSIKHGINYPSRTEACSSCSFNRRCKL